MFLHRFNPASPAPSINKRFCLLVFFACSFGLNFVSRINLETNLIPVRKNNIKTQSRIITVANSIGWENAKITIAYTDEPIVVDFRILIISVEFVYLQSP